MGPVVPRGAQASLNPYQGHVGFLELYTPRWNHEVISFVEASFIGRIPHYMGEKKPFVPYFASVLTSFNPQLIGVGAL